MGMSSNEGSVWSISGDADKSPTMGLRGVLTMTRCLADGGREILFFPYPASFCWKHRAFQRLFRAAKSAAPLTCLGPAIAAS